MLKSLRVDIPHIGALMPAIGFVRQPRSGHYACVSGAEPTADFERSAGRDLYGQDPDAYAAGRPAYPEVVYELLRDRCHPGDGAHVLEIGPGTGLVTQRLVSWGASVTCVEPNPALAAFLRRSLPDTDIEILATSFEDAPLADGMFDIGVAATSFHWVDQRIGTHKLRRVIRPGGWVAIWWMLFEDPNTVDAFDSAIQSVLGPPLAIMDSGRPPFQIDVDARCADLRDAGFVEVRSEILQTNYTFDAPALRALYATMAIVLRRPEEERTHVLDALQALVQRDFGGAITRPFVTALYTAQVPTCSDA
jgi:Methyltransferase domain